MTLAERLEAGLDLFRHGERPHDIQPMVSDAIALRVAEAWKKLPLVLVDPLFLGAPPMHRQNRWKYVWRFRPVDVDELARQAGTSVEEARVAFEKLRDAFLVYPDGTLHSELDKRL